MKVQSLFFSLVDMMGHRLQHHFSGRGVFLSYGPLQTGSPPSTCVPALPFLSPLGQEGAVRGMCGMGAEGMGGLLSERLISGSQGAAEQIAEVYAY